MKNAATIVVALLVAASVYGQSLHTIRGNMVEMADFCEREGQDHFKLGNSIVRADARANGLSLLKEVAYSTHRSGTRKVTGSLDTYRSVLAKVAAQRDAPASTFATVRALPSMVADLRAYAKVPRDLSSGSLSRDEAYDRFASAARAVGQPMEVAGRKLLSLVSDFEEMF